MIILTYITFSILGFILGYIARGKVRYMAAYYQGRADVLDKWGDVLSNWRYTRGKYKDIHDNRINDSDMMYVENQIHGH